VEKSIRFLHCGMVVLYELPEKMFITLILGTWSISYQQKLRTLHEQNSIFIRRNSLYLNFPDINWKASIDAIFLISVIYETLRTNLAYA
jgi:hypothetical protein